MSTLTRDQIEAIFYQQLTNFQGYARLPEPDRISLLQQLSPQINPMESLTESLEGVPRLFLDAAEGAVSTASAMIVGARTVIHTVDPELIGATDEKIREAAVAAANAVENARNPGFGQGFMNSASDFFYALTKSFSFEWPPFSMEAFQEAMAIAPIRRQGIAVYDAIKPLLGTNAAYAMSGIDNNSEIRSGAIPPFLSPDAPEVQTLNAYAASHPAPEDLNYFEEMIQHISENPVQGAARVAGSLFVLRALGVPITPSAAWSATRGIAIAGWHAGAGAIDVISGATSLASGAVRHPFQSIQHLPETSAALARRTAQREATLAGAGVARYGARWVGRLGAVVGFIPLVGGIWSSGESLIFGNEAYAAHENGDLTNEELALISSALAAHAALGFGGFLSGAFDEAQLLALATNERLAPYLPPSVVEVVGDLFVGENAQIITALERPSYLNPREGAQPLPTWYDDDAINLQFNLAAEAFSQGAIDENHPVIQALLQDRLLVLSRATPALSSEEQAAAVESFYAAVRARGEILHTNREELMRDSGWSHADVQGFYAGQPFALRYEEISSDDLYRGIPNQQYVPMDWSEGSQYRQHMTAQELANDLLQRGPVYWRLMDQALARGESLEDFTQDVRLTLDHVTASYIAEGRASLIYDFGSTDVFGGLDSPYLALATATEWDRFEALDGHIETLFASLNQNIQASTEQLNTVMRAYFIREDGANPSYGEMALALRENTYLISWLQERGVYEEWQARFASWERSSPDARFDYSNNPLWQEFFASIQTDQAATDAYLTAFEESLAGVQASYGLIAPLITSDQTIDQAILAAEQAILQIYALPDPSILPDASAQPELAAVLQQAADIRALVEATPDSNTLFASEEFTVALHTFMANSEGVLSNGTPASPQTASLSQTTDTAQFAGLTDDDLLSILATASVVQAPAPVAFSNVTGISAPIDVAVANGLVPLTTGASVGTVSSIG